MTDRTAKIIRKATVPPVMILYLVIVLAVSGQDAFRSPGEVLLLLFLLGIVPVLAYPLQRFIPGLKNQGRNGQRKLAFIFTFLGYTVNFLLALSLHMNRNYVLVASTYFLSILFLSVLNIFTKLKASGHACSFTGPAALLGVIVHPVFIAVGTLIAVPVCHASVILKRHTPAQLAGGIIVCVISFLISCFFFPPCGHLAA